MPAPPTTRVIELTPTGRAAVAVVLVSGPDAVRCVNECFCCADGRQLESFASGRILVGRWGAPDGEELVVCRRSDEEVEVHCHGGVAAVRAVVDLLCERGCASTHWQDWLGESEADPIRTAAQIELADAPTARTAAVLLDQYQGALSSAIRSVLDAATAGEWETASAALDAILVQRGVGLHLTKPWRVVLAGRPNVGKSSLMNALVGFQRAIVCDLPGTTRDVVTAMTAIDGWPIQLADTAGLRSTRDEIELAGVTRATAAAGAADLVLLVEDCARKQRGCSANNDSRAASAQQDRLAAGATRRRRAAFRRALQRRHRQGRRRPGCGDWPCAEFRCRRPRMPRFHLQPSKSRGWNRRVLPRASAMPGRSPAVCSRSSADGWLLPAMMQRFHRRQRYRAVKIRHQFAGQKLTKCFQMSR